MLIATLLYLAVFLWVGSANPLFIAGAIKIAVEAIWNVEPLIVVLIILGLPLAGALLAARGALLAARGLLRAIESPPESTDRGAVSSHTG